MESCRRGFTFVIAAAQFLLLLSLKQLPIAVGYCDTSALLSRLDQTCFSSSIADAQSLVREASTCAQQWEPGVINIFTPIRGIIPLLAAVAAAYPNYTATHPTTYSFPGSPSYVPSFSAFVDDHVPLTAGPYADMASEFNHTILEYHDAFLMDAESVPEFATAGLLAPLDRFITQDAELDWFRIDRFYRGYSAIFEQLSFTSRDANSTNGTQVADATAANATTSNANETSSPNVTSTYGIPVTGAGFMLMYRADVFVAANASVPATWEELLQLARGWAGKDIDSDGRPEYPVCMPRGGPCGRAVLLTVAAPYVQTQGPTQGVTLDPTDGSTLLTSAGFVRALDLVAELAQLGPPEDAGRCWMEDAGAFGDAFLEGKCIMTVGTFGHFKRYAAPDSLVRTLLGVAVSPGSSTVLNRTSGMLEPCTADLCPYGKRVPRYTAPRAAGDIDAAIIRQLQLQLQQEQTDRNLYTDDDLTVGTGFASGSSSSVSTRTNSTNTTTKGAGGGAGPGGAKQDGAAGGGESYDMLVSYAPYMQGGLVGVASSRNPLAVVGEVVRFFTSMSEPENSFNNMANRRNWLSPYRTEQWAPAYLDRWVSAGFLPGSVAQMQATLSEQHGSRNVAPPLRLPGQNQITLLVSNAVATVASGQVSAAEVAAQLEAAVLEVLTERFPQRTASGLPGYLPLYRSQLGYVEPVSPPAPYVRRATRVPPVSRRAVVVIAVVLGLVVLLSGVVAWEVRNKRRHMDLLGRVKPPMGDPDTTIVVASMQDFDELWEALISEASERALQQFSVLVDGLLRRHSGYRGACEEEEVVVAAFHSPRDAVAFALELQRGLLGLKWPRSVLEMEQFKPQYLAEIKSTTGDSATGQGSDPAEDDKLFSLTATVADGSNVRSFGEQCVASWMPADPLTNPKAELVFSGIRARVGLCAVGASRLLLEAEPLQRGRVAFSGRAVAVAAAAAAAGQGGMVLIPQSTFRQLHLELLAEQCLFCHLGEYQLDASLPPMDLYLALDRGLAGRLALFGPLTAHCVWSQGAFAAPVQSAAMVFTHVVGVQTLLAWNYELVQEVIETFTRLAQTELQQAGGYLVEHVEGFMLTAFHSPADAILWGLRLQELMLKEDWPEELLQHELCEEVVVAVPVRGGEVASATVFRGPRLKTGIDIGPVVAQLHTITGRMTYRGKVMNRAARISAAASSGQVLCSAEAWEACTSSASAVRLVTATSLGLFQLKGIAERIEVFHCTYQRHIPSSTRRSSVVSVGLPSSSENAANRRRSAVVLSTASHSSHRTSLHTSHTVYTNSGALDHTGGLSSASVPRRASHASGSVHGGPRNPSFNHAQLSDVLHLMGLDPVSSQQHAYAYGSSSRGSVAGAPALAVPVPLSPRGIAHAHRVQGSSGGGGYDGDASGKLPGVVGAAGGAGGEHTPGHVSPGSGSVPSGTTAARAALAAVLQSRTRSASSLFNASVLAGRRPPERSASARARFGAGGANGVLTSLQSSGSGEPQAALTTHSPARRTLSGLSGKGSGSFRSGGRPAFVVHSPPPGASLVMAAAAGASYGSPRPPDEPFTLAAGGTYSPKAAAALDGRDHGPRPPSGPTRSGSAAAGAPWSPSTRSDSQSPPPCVAGRLEPLVTVEEAHQEGGATDSVAGTSASGGTLPSLPSPLHSGDGRPPTVVTAAATPLPPAVAAPNPADSHAGAAAVPAGATKPNTSPTGAAAAGAPRLLALFGPPSSDVQSTGADLSMNNVPTAYMYMPAHGIGFHDPTSNPIHHHESTTLIHSHRHLLELQHPPLERSASDNIPACNTSAAGAFDDRSSTHVETLEVTFSSNALAANRRVSGSDVGYLAHARATCHSSTQSNTQAQSSARNSRRGSATGGQHLPSAPTPGQHPHPQHAAATLLALSGSEVQVAEAAMGSSAPMERASGTQGVGGIAGQAAAEVAEGALEGRGDGARVQATDAAAVVPTGAEGCAPGATVVAAGREEDITEARGAKGGTVGSGAAAGLRMPVALPSSGSSASDTGELGKAAAANAVATESVVATGSVAAMGSGVLVTQISSGDDSGTTFLAMLPEFSTLGIAASKAAAAADAPKIPGGMARAGSSTVAANTTLSKLSILSPTLPHHRMTSPSVPAPGSAGRAPTPPVGAGAGGSALRTSQRTSSISPDLPAASLASPCSPWLSGHSLKSSLRGIMTATSSRAQSGAHTTVAASAASSRGTALQSPGTLRLVGGDNAAATGSGGGSDGVVLAADVAAEMQLPGLEAGAGRQREGRHAGAPARVGRSGRAEGDRAPDRGEALDAAPGGASGSGSGSGSGESPLAPEERRGSTAAGGDDGMGGAGKQSAGDVLGLAEGTGRGRRAGGGGTLSPIMSSDGCALAAAFGLGGEASMASHVQAVDLSAYGLVGVGTERRGPGGSGVNVVRGPTAEEMAHAMKLLGEGSH